MCFEFETPVPSKYDTEADYYAKGVIRKKDFVDGAVYRGESRCTDEATWCAERNMFEYKRTKFGETFTDVVDALEDDRGYDVFLPVERLK